MSSARLYRLCLAFLVVCVVAACSGKKTKKDDTGALLKAEELYNDALDLFEAKKYSKAIAVFEEIESTYPYSKWATKAQVISAYTNYKNSKYDDAILILDKFIQTHPGNKDISYAYYLRALCFYEQISDTKRDQGYTVLAKDNFAEVIARFPGSDYARDSSIKLDLVNERLAGKEMRVGKFYLKDKNYVGAINRFLEIVNNYDTTSYAKEALYRLVETYTILGIESEAQRYAATLGYNYPASRWYKKSYSLLNRKASKKEHKKSKS